MKVNDPSSIFEACDGNVVVFSKIVLSYFRRLRDLYLFQKEGRITITGDDSATPSTREARPEGS